MHWQLKTSYTGSIPAALRRLSNPVCQCKLGHMLGITEVVEDSRQVVTEEDRIP